MNNYIPADKRPSIGEKVPVTDILTDQVLLELQKEHTSHCPADHDDDNPVIIWIDPGKGYFSDGRSLYCYAECQRCMKSGWTSLKEDDKYHATKPTPRGRHAKRA